MWIAPRAGQLYAPGLAGLGLDPNRLIVVEPPSRALRLWALAEAVRLPGLAAVVAELEAVDFTASRRLQLAAARSGVTAFLLAEEDVAPTQREATAARTRWRVTAMTSAAAIGVGRPRWRLELLRGPGAASGTWIVEPTHDGFRHPALASATATSGTAPRAGAVAALLRDRSPRARVG
jgi:protein ImuA